MNEPHISRKLGVITATSIVVANMIGAGIFTTSGIMASNLPDANWILLCWIFGGGIAMAGALCYAELATRMPEEGGEYIYLKRLYHPVVGFLTGWTSFLVGFSAPIAASALGSIAYISAGLTEGVSHIDSAQITLLQKSCAVLLIILFTLIHYLGLKLGAFVQNLLTAVKILIIFGLAALGLIFGKGDWTHFSFATDSRFGTMALGTAMMLVMFSYSGWNASAYIAGELKDPRKSLPISLISGTAIVMILYLLINLFIFYSVPYSQLQGNITVVESATAMAFGENVSNILGLFIGIALLSSLSAFILIGPRVYFAMALDRLFFPYASKVHPKYEVPGRSIIIQGLIAVVMVMLGSFEQLLIYIGFALSIFPWLAIAGLFIARRRHIGDNSAVKVWGYPFIPIFFLVSSLLLMIVAFYNRPVESTAAIVTILIGIPSYYIWLRGIKLRGK
jgi:APA family basic amino acid/polyamine antiporter